MLSLLHNNRVWLYVMFNLCSRKDPVQNMASYLRAGGPLYQVSGKYKLVYLYFWIDYICCIINATRLGKTTFQSGQKWGNTTGFWFLLLFFKSQTVLHILHKIISVNIWTNRNTFVNHICYNYAFRSFTMKEEKRYKVKLVQCSLVPTK